MKIVHFKADGFRNLESIDYAPCDTVNILYGDNGQGKTNLMEAMALFTGLRSFRGAKENEMLGFDKKLCTMEMKFADEQREQTIKMQFGEKKKYSLNGVPLKSSSALSGAFYCVVFSPSHLMIIQRGPKERRSFLDKALMQLKPNYARHLADYEKVIIQRNALLKTQSPYVKEQLELWDVQLARLGTILTIYRQDYVQKLERIAVPIYEKLTGKREEIGLSYHSTIFGVSQLDRTLREEYMQQYKQELENNFENDCKSGSTAAGIHRDDILIKVNGRDAKIYGSQGQQRSCILTMKLAEAAIIKYYVKENPIVILDDVLSELDANRQEYIINCLKNLQVFITCCESNDTLKKFNGNVRYIRQGRLQEEMVH